MTTLSHEQIKARDGRLTASRVACLVTGDEQKIMDLWKEMIGDPTYVPEDLSDVWAVQLGAHTESLNLEWYERRVGYKLSRQGEVIVHPEHDWAACTLDAFDEKLNAPVEAKHVGGFEKIATVLERYAPQAHWQMLITATDKCIFTVIEGAREPIIEVANFDDAYAAELWRRAEQFMQCVWNLTPPVTLPPVAPPVKPVKTYDMTGNNAWASESVTWITTRKAAKDNADAHKALKEMVPADAIKCHGHGIAISRNRAGSLTLREME